MTNPYESPKEPSQPLRNSYKFSLGMGCLLASSVPAGFICGGVTCYSAGVAGEAANTEAGWTLGIPLALVVALVVPLVAYLLFRRASR